MNHPELLSLFENNEEMAEEVQSIIDNFTSQRAWKILVHADELIEDKPSIKAVYVLEEEYRHILGYSQLVKTLDLSSPDSDTIRAKLILFLESLLIQHSPDMQIKHLAIKEIRRQTIIDKVS